MRPEPELEELSAYLDQELTGAQRQELESHLAGCETCRRRLESLRQTVHALKELPREAPPRAFTIPPQRAQRRRFTPQGWAAGLAAVAVLALVVAVAFPRGGGAPPTTAGSSSAQRNIPYGPASKAAGAGHEYDRAAQALAAAAPLANETWLSGASSTQLRLATDNTAYQPAGKVTVRVILSGPAVGKAGSSGDAGLQLFLVSANAGSNGPGRTLPAMPASQRSDGLAAYQRGYAVSSLGVPAPGDYRLIAIWTPSGGSGDVLVAEVRIFLTSR
jgi:anti-sigma factor RsiW